MQKAVFLDKDGTIIKDVPYNADISKIVFMPGAVEALSSLQELGYALIIISNQSGIEKRLLTVEDVTNVGRYLEMRLLEFGVKINGFYFCPHAQKGNGNGQAPCPCRKPEPGLLLDAAQDNKISLRQSWMIGDILDDVEAGNRAGCRSILIDSGNESQWRFTSARCPHYTCKTLVEAAEIIRKNGG